MSSPQGIAVAFQIGRSIFGIFFCTMNAGLPHNETEDKMIAIVTTFLDCASEYYICIDYVSNVSVAILGGLKKSVKVYIYIKKY